MTATKALLAALVLALAGCGLQAHDTARRAVSGPAPRAEKAIAPLEILPTPGIPPTTDESIVDMSLG